MSLLVIYELLGLFVNTLTANNKYFLCNEKSLPQPIQMQLSKKKTFSECFGQFQKSASHFNYFQKKDGPDSSCISEITDCERLG